MSNQTRILLTHGHALEVNLTVAEVEARLQEAGTQNARFGSATHGDIHNTDAFFNPKDVVALIAI